MSLEQEYVERACAVNLPLPRAFFAPIFQRTSLGVQRVEMIEKLHYRTLFGKELIHKATSDFWLSSYFVGTIYADLKHESKSIKDAEFFDQFSDNEPLE